MENPLITDNLNLVHEVLKRMGVQHSRNDYDDWYQQGCLALCKAANGFKEDKGCKFSTYAFSTIRNELSGFFYCNQLIKMKSQKKREQTFCEVEDWIPMPQEDDNSLVDSQAIKIKRIRNILKSDDALQLALDLFSDKHWSDEDVALLKSKYANYDGMAYLAVKRGDIKKAKSQLTQLIRKHLGIRHKFRHA